MESLPDEALVRIFSLLPIAALGALACCNRRLAEVASDDEPWRAAYERSFARFGPAEQRLARWKDRVRLAYESSDYVVADDGGRPSLRLLLARTRRAAEGGQAVALIEFLPRPALGSPSARCVRVGNAARLADDFDALVVRATEAACHGDVVHWSQRCSDVALISSPGGTEADVLERESVREAFYEDPPLPNDGEQHRTIDKHSCMYGDAPDDREGALFVDAFVHACADSRQFRAATRGKKRGSGDDNDGGSVAVVAASPDRLDVRSYGFEDDDCAFRFRWETQFCGRFSVRAEAAAGPIARAQLESVGVVRYFLVLPDVELVADEFARATLLGRDDEGAVLQAAWKRCSESGDALIAAAVRDDVDDERKPARRGGAGAGVDVRLRCEPVVVRRPGTCAYPELRWAIDIESAEWSPAPRPAPRRRRAAEALESTCPVGFDMISRAAGGGTCWRVRTVRPFSDEIRRACVELTRALRDFGAELALSDFGDWACDFDGSRVRLAVRRDGSSFFRVERAPDRVRALESAP